MADFKKTVLAVSTLAGTIIGVGIFSLPYITLKAGPLVMLGYFLVLGPLVILVHYLFGKVALNTPDFLRLPGYAKKHLGNWAKNIATVSTVLGLFGALLAYLIVGGAFLENLLSPIFGGNNLVWTLFYCLAGAFLIFFGMKAISKIEFLGLLGFFAVLFLIFFLGKDSVDNGFFGIGNWKFLPAGQAGEIGNFFLPYGPILFSLWGASLIPEVEEMLGAGKKRLGKIILVSIAIPILVYLFFIYLILGISGKETAESALPSLRNFLGEEIFALGLIFGIFTTFTSFIALGLNLRNVLNFDLKINKRLAFAIACFFPLLLFLIGIKNFIPVISVLGGIFLGVDGILILLMYKKLNPKKFWVPPLITLFFGGIIYEIIYFVK